MPTVWQAAAEQFHRRENFVVAIITAIHGSSPRHMGTRFLIRQDGSFVGTIGGGLFESQVLQSAISALETGTSHRMLFDFKGKDASSLDMICGGGAEVLIEFVNAENQTFGEICSKLAEISKQGIPGYLFTDLALEPGQAKQGSLDHLLVFSESIRVGGFPGEEWALIAVPSPRFLKEAQILSVPGRQAVLLEWIHPTGTAYIFGAGHVGRCVAHLAAYVDFKVVMIDDRDDLACMAKVPDANHVLVAPSFDNVFSSLDIDEDAYVVIVTRGHAHDKLVLEQALRTPAGYIGMIGSKRKTKLILDALLSEGFSAEDLRRVHAPIGLPIGGETPQEIAVSIIAEMIDLRYQKSKKAS
jgi:xanthine dehydrogenase accessory factor